MPEPFARNSRLRLIGASSRLRLMGALTVPLALAGCDEPPAPPQTTVTGVRVQKAEATRIADSVTLTGAIQARVQSDLSFRFAGRIVERFADVGDHVRAGQVLAKLDTSQQEADVAAANAALAAADATVRQTEATFERQKALIGQGFTTRTLYDNANQAFLAAKADVEIKTSELGVARDRLDKAELRADASGVVTARYGEAGQVVDVGQAVFALAQDGPRDAVFEVYESLLARPPENGETVRVTLLSNRSVTATGRVREVSPAVNGSTGTVRVKVVIDDTPREMGLGAAISGAGDFRPRDAVVLPQSAFFSRNDRPVVWVVDAKTNVATERQVEIDSFRTGSLLLKTGVSAGDLVVTAGAQFLRPGETVLPVLDGNAPEAAR